MSPRKQEPFVTVTNAQAWDMFNELKKSVDNIGSLVSNLKEEVADVKTIIQRHDMLLQKYESLRNIIIGGWIVLVFVGGLAAFSINSYIRSVVEQVVENYNIEIIN